MPILSVSTIISSLAVQRKESPSAVAVDQTRAARARSAPPRSSTGGVSRGADLVRAARV